MTKTSVSSTETRQSSKTAFRTCDRRRLFDLRRRDDYEAAYSESEPLVSVYIPTFERAELILSRTLPSVYRQDYENWEVVIIGDGMKEDQANLLRKITRKRVCFHNLSKRGNYPSDPVAHWYTAGMKPANFALRMVKGRWITPLDDDDEFTSNHISSLLGLGGVFRVIMSVESVVGVARSGSSAEPGHAGRRARVVLY